MIKETNIDGFYCQFCGKKCKNLNSLKQHEVRCPKNPNRRDFNKLTKYIQNNIKGETAKTSASIAKQVATMHDKYANGYKKVVKPGSREFISIYSDHNQREISKWLDYISGKQFTIPEYQVSVSNTGYKYLINYKQANSKCNIIFEHNFIANILIDGTLECTNTIHHINKDRSDNNPYNLMVFIDNNNHKRYHNSKYAKLFYDEHSHKFSCILEKIKVI